MGDFVFFNDIYSLATGKDWLSGSKKNKLESAAWLALAAFPVSKLSKIAKELKAGNKLLKGVDLSAKDLRILQDAGYFGESATKGVAKNIRNADELSKIGSANVIKRTDAEKVNSSFPKDFQPPYKPGTLVNEIELTETSKVGEFVRVYTEGKTTPAGGWVMLRKDIETLTPEQIQSKFALPYKPTNEVDVILPKGAKVRQGVANEAFGHKGGGIQFDLNGKRMGEFINPRTIK
ncbi:hypothetical protein RU86_GL001643 [Lactococcus piscium]|uniref:Pre-toxin TG domain-containing protein n=1 Tax=Pseudolactococcus piscium TaxID=1364 RepID=A0A2A5RUI5_9LACT|nr:hypothetical protein [Lactococcus piscium]PCS04309.1 hypothetical protein RU86_GL001643 [Lactococcus piscium]